MTSPQPGSSSPTVEQAHADEVIAFSRPAFGPEEAAGAADAVSSGWVVGGPRLLAFERRLAELGGAGHAVGVSSWTTGAFLVLHAWGIGPGDEVIVPSLTFIASVNVIRHCGATPIFADVGSGTLNIDPDDVAKKISSRTRVIMPVDQLGLPCDMDAIGLLARRHGLRVLDDAACALGSRSDGRPIGSMADVTVFSLHARKVVTTGEGGVILTDDGDFAARLRRLRHQGMSVSDFDRHGARPTAFETYPEIGFNHRLTDIQAAIGLAQLDRLDWILRRRSAIAERYGEALQAHPFITPPQVPPKVQPNWQSYQVTVSPDAPLERNAIMDRLFDLGIPTRRGVMASHLEAPYRSSDVDLPVTEFLARQGMQLPMHPNLTDGQQRRVIEAILDLS